MVSYALIYNLWLCQPSDKGALVYRVPFYLTERFITFFFQQWGCSLFLIIYDSILAAYSPWDKECSNPFACYMEALVL